MTEAAPAAEAVTVRSVLARAAGVLSRAGCETPRLDAELLLAHVLHCDRAGLVIGGREPVGAVALRRFEGLLARRADREPVAYIVERREFRRLSLHVDRRVLIPRPETELLVEVGLGLPAGVGVIDVGTGSGAVALALKEERPDLDVVGVDASADAIAVARLNAERLRLDVRFIVADLLDGADEPYAVLANLPYVADGTELAPEIERYEPARALFAGEDGLSVIRRLVDDLVGVELAALEIGPEQAGAVSELLHEAGFEEISVLRDLAGRSRVVVGQR